MISGDSSRRAVLAALTGTAAMALMGGASGDIGAASVAGIERKRVLAAAERYLVDPPKTITAFTARRSTGTAHDYYSEADYWWPDPQHPGGAYVRRDGYSNPDKFDDHRLALIRLGIELPALTAAWLEARDPRYAKHAARHLDAWFIDPATRMNPNLDHAQAIIGVNSGRGIGVIDTLQLVEVAQAAMRLRDTRAIAPALSAGVDRWFRDYLTWLTTSANGRDEAGQKNNHGSAYALQVAAFARLTGQADALAQQRRVFRERLVPLQIAPDGRQPLELARTKPYSYSLFNLDVLSTLALVASTPADDLWRFETSDGRGLAKALAFMAPFIRDKRTWPFPPDVEHFDNLPVRNPALLFGGLAVKRQDYLKLWTTLNPDPHDPEIIRNFPVRQPLVWM